MTAAPSMNSPHAGAEKRPDVTQMRLPILLSILLPVGWLCLTLLYVGFWSTGFTLFQSVIVILVSILVLGGLMGGLWTYWGTRRHVDWWD